MDQPGWLDTSVRRGRHGIRSLRRTPAFFVFVILTLALGIGANAGLFTVTNAVLLRWLPVKNPTELYFIDVQGGRSLRGASSYSLFASLKDSSTQFAELAGFQSAEVRVIVDDQFQSISGQFASGNLFPLLGVQAELGRTLLPQDDRPTASPVAVISHRYWQRQFGGATDVLGKSIRVSGRAAIIVGVIEPAFTGLQPGRQIDVTFPLTLAPARALRNKTAAFLNVIGRLRPAGNLIVAQEELQSRLVEWNRSEGIPEAMQRDYMNGVSLISAGHGQDGLVRQFRRPLFALTALAGGILLLTWINVASLLFGRVIGRENEVCARVALGANRSELIGQLLTDVLILAISGTVAGTFASWLAVDAFPHMLARADEHFYINLRPDLRMVLPFSIAMAATTALVCSVPSALWMFGVAPAQVLRREPRTVMGFKSGIGRALVAGQLAVALILLTGAGLLVETLRHLEAVDKGFDPSGVLAIRLDANPTVFSEEQIRELWPTLLDNIRPVPGVGTSALSSLTPLSSDSAGAMISVPGFIPQSPPDLEVTRNEVSSDYFRVMRIPFVAGRAFADADAHASVAIVNEAAAKFYFGGIQQAVGRAFAFGRSSSALSVQIVGVARDTTQQTLRERPPRLVYVPLSEALEEHYSLTLTTRTMGNPQALENTIRARIRAFSRQIAVADVRTLTQQVNDSLTQERTLALLSSMFGGVALLLAAIGLYGMVWQSVSRRTSEIGVRIAIGATRLAVARTVAKEILQVLGAGVALGVVGSAVTGRMLEGQLFGVRPVDPVVIAYNALLLTIIVAASSAAPVRRAMRLDPIVALRTE